MKSIIGFAFVTAFFAGATAFAADIFVREAHGVGLSRQQSEEITQMVEKAIEEMPEHRLVASEDLADFILEPSITMRDDALALRVDKWQNNEIVASSIEPLPEARLNQDHVRSATENVLIAEAMETDESVSGAPTGDESREGWGNSPTQRSPDRGSVSRSPDSFAASDSPMGAGDVRAPSPLFARPDRRGAFQIGAGPAFSTGMESDQMMYNLNAAYVMPFGDLFSAKAFGDFNLSAGSDPHRFLNFGIGAELYPMGATTMGRGRPYVAGDIGYALTRNKNDVTQDAPAVGVGGGYRFLTQQLNMDVNLHYTMLTAKLEDKYPAVLGLRAAVNF